MGRYRNKKIPKSKIKKRDNPEASPLNISNIKYKRHRLINKNYNFNWM